MTITSKPATRAYSKGFDRIFKKKWGVMVGQPTSEHPCPKDKQILSRVGAWLIHILVPKLFDTRAAARKEAKRMASENRMWNYHAKKYDGRPCQEV